MGGSSGRVFYNQLIPLPVWLQLLIVGGGLGGGQNLPVLACLWRGVATVLHVACSLVMPGQLSCTAGGSLLRAPCAWHYHIQRASLTMAMLHACGMRICHSDLAHCQDVTCKHPAARMSPTSTRLPGPCHHAPIHHPAITFTSRAPNPCCLPADPCCLPADPCCLPADPCCLPADPCCLPPARSCVCCAATIAALLASSMTCSCWRTTQQTSTAGAAR